MKEYLLKRTNILGDDEQTRVNLLFRGGLRIYTTLDPNLQALAEQARRDQLPANTTGIEAAMMTLDTEDRCGAGDGRRQRVPAAA